MIKIPFKDRIIHMLCGVLILAGLEKLCMAVSTFEYYLRWKAGLFVENTAMCVAEGLGCIFLALFVSYLLSEFEEN